MDNTNEKYNNTLYSFATCGKDVDFNNKLIYLAQNLAEREEWDLDEDKGVSILRKYIFTTFARCKEQNRILYSDNGEYCAVNTGLLSNNGCKEIIMYFTRNIFQDYFNKENVYQKDWYFAGFKLPSDKEYISAFKGKIPEIATYTNNIEDYFFNPNLPIQVDIEHIVDDNWERVSKEIDLPKEVVRYMINGVLEVAIKKAKRNYRLVVPQYYQEKIGYLLPLDFPVADDKYVTMALAIEKMDGVYRANTIYNKKDAYSKARVLMQVNNNWLLK